MLKRNALIFLEKWFQQKKRKPLILRGARQVGKSTLVRLFCSLQQIHLIEVNLEIIPINRLDDVRNIGEVNAILEEISIRLKKKIVPGCLLFLDEIQSKPNALPFLRYLYEQRPDLAVVAAGSLLEFILNDHDFSMPVGRIEYFHLGPLTFSEFLLALGETQLLQQIQKSPESSESTFNEYFDILTERLRTYFFIGGMPEAVASYVETLDITQARNIHRSIIQTYRDDFPKYARQKSIEKIKLIFDSLANFVGKKVRYSEIQGELPSKIVKEALELFKNARILHFCYHTNAKGIPLRGLRDEKTYRYFFLDIGLLMYLLGVPEEFVLMKMETHPLVKGLLAEQFVAQHLAYLADGLEEPELYYWVRDKKTEAAELDFLFVSGGRIIPVEVKSGSAGKMKSLLSYMASHQSDSKGRGKIDQEKKLALRLDLKKRKGDEVQEVVKFKIPFQDGVKSADFILINIPLFGTEWCNKFIGDHDEHTSD